MPDAATISVAETLGLLDTDFKELADGVAKGEYALWLGSGISRNRVPDLRVIVRRVLDYLSAGARAEGGTGPHSTALATAIRYALTASEAGTVLLTEEPAAWPNLNVIIDRLVGRYSELLDIRLPGRRDDYLLWEIVDVRETYANDALRPDCEHLAVAVLVLEGVAAEIASANWDPLIEKAVARLRNGNPDVLSVRVRGDDMRGASSRSQLYKYHGCAMLAKTDVGKYREYIIGRKSQIVEWPTDQKFNVMRNRLGGLTSTSRTLMIGLSAQDSNIQAVFATGRAMMNWPYPSHPPAYAFAEENLGADQETMLKCVYREAFDEHQNEILTGARIPAYGKSLLSALVLSVLGQKAKELVRLADASHLTGPERTRLEDGVMSMRNAAAAAVGTSDVGKLAFMETLIGDVTRNLAMFRGDMAAHAANVYGPVGVFPIGQQAGDPNLQASGMPELAVLIGLLGIGCSEDGWSVTRVADDLFEGTLVVRSPASAAPRKLFAVASSEVLTRLVLDGVIDDGDPNSIVLVCTAVVSPQQRNPGNTYGRDEARRCCEIGLRSLVAEAASAGHLLARLKEEATL